MKQLKDDLFRVVQYCHDNDKDFIKQFMINKEVSTLNGIYFSGSQCMVVYLGGFTDTTAIIKTSLIFDWMTKRGFKL